jgi:hypothetical protein
VPPAFSKELATMSLEVTNQVAALHAEISRGSRITDSSSRPSAASVDRTKGKGARFPVRCIHEPPAQIDSWHAVLNGTYWRA